MDAATIVRRVRALVGITRKDLALLAGVSPSTISRIEAEALDPSWGMLSRILDATGYRISGDSIVSAGDPTAITAASSVLQAALSEPFSQLPSEAVDETIATDKSAAQSERWIARWTRAGWLSEQPSMEDMVRLAVSAGNAGRITRRNVSRRTVAVKGGWRVLAQELSNAGIDYAISGLLAARDDRATATSISSMIYVEDPAQTVAALALSETSPGEGVLLLAATGGELERTETEGGIRFVSRAQGVIDAFAGSGREPDKAEDTLRHLLAASA